MTSEKHATIRTALHWSDNFDTYDAFLAACEWRTGDVGRGQFDNLEPKKEKDKKTMIDKAMDLASNYHGGMVDKYGNSYFEHLDRVADRVREMEYDFVDETSEIEMYVATAYLHDIIEDTDCTREDLVALFPEFVVEAVFRLTRDEGVTYAEYIERILSRDIIPTLAGKIARVVKLADLLDHVSGPTPCPPSLIKRYEKSLYRLISKGFA